MLRSRTPPAWPSTAQAAAQIQGVARVLLADAPQLAEQLAENVAAQVLAIAKNYSHILFPATAHGKNVAPRVAAKLDVAQVSEISKVVSADTFERAKDHVLELLCRLVRDALSAAARWLFSAGTFRHCVGAWHHLTSYANASGIVRCGIAIARIPEDSPNR